MKSKIEYYIQYTLADGFVLQTPPIELENIDFIKQRLMFLYSDPTKAAINIVVKSRTIIERDFTEVPDLSSEELISVNLFLYQLLDNIDTAGDIAKSNNEFYRKIVEFQQSLKSMVVAANDGRSIQFKVPLIDLEKVSKIENILLNTSGGN